MDFGYFYSMRETMGWLAIVWIVTILYSFMAYLLQILLFKGVNKLIIIILQHVTQSFIFVYVMIIFWKTKWVHSHYLFNGILFCVIFFKMHSYTVSNLEYHAEYIEKHKKGIVPNKDEYPNNINFKNYLIYLAMPTFVYKCHYPRSETKFRFTYFVSKLGLALLLIVFF